MPELPEVETVLRGIRPALIGHRFSRIHVRRKDLRTPIPPQLAQMAAGSRITGLERRAKYILMHLANGQSLLLHLGMSGRLQLTGRATPPALHDHVIFEISGGASIHFNDPRRFGLLTLAPTRDLPQHKLLRHLGAEPLARDFNGACLYAQLKLRKSPVKTAIMDQRLVVGVGNIYASEALFAAHIRPQRAAKSLSRQECGALARSIKAVLRRAIAKGGSTLRDYRQAGGELGYFQHEFRVYGRAGEPCPTRGCSGVIGRITQGGRSSFYCPSCQR